MQGRLQGVSIKEGKCENAVARQITVPDASQMGLFTDGHFLPIPRELVFIFDYIRLLITYA